MTDFGWNKHTWELCSNAQNIDYEDEQSLARILKQLECAPRIIQPRDIQQLKHQLAQAELGRQFFIQAGDCAEAFHACKPTHIRQQVQLIHQLQTQLQKSTGQPVLAIGRIAGQYAKPRTKLIETQGQVMLPSYRGDLINQFDWNERARAPQPRRLLTGYQKAKFTYQYVEKIYKKWAGFMYTSHEALHLPFETALTRFKHPLKQNAKAYNAATHLPWIGMRTAHVDGAHVAYLSGLMNPIGIKVGPRLSPDHLVELCQKLNPPNLSGKMVLITRLGVEHVEAALPSFIQAIRAAGLSVVWACDPMHGNTQLLAPNVKTRSFDDIWHELKLTHQLHQRHQSRLCGIHLELTPEQVNECSGGEKGANQTQDTASNYTSLMDPRLNAEQAQALMHKLGQLLCQKRT